MTDTLKTIKRSASHFFSGTLLSRISGMLRDVSMAYAFGTQPALALFMIAYRFAHLFRRVFGEGALQSAFIPEFETLRQQNPERAGFFFRDLVYALSVGLLSLIGCVESVLACFLIWGNLSPSNHELIRLTMIMLPSLLFICLFGLNASFLQCQKRYFISSVAPVAFNLIWIGAVLYLNSFPIQEAMIWLAFSVIIACFCQWLMTIPSAWLSYKKIFSSSSEIIPSQFLSSDVRALFKPLALGILGVSASQINQAIDSLFAYYASDSGAALLWYAIRIQQFPLALFSLAIASAVLPPLARAIKTSRTEDYHEFLNYALSRTWNFILPLSALLMLTADSCVALIYGRGDFGIDSIKGTTTCLWAYNFGLLPTALVLILAPASYAHKNYILPSLASALNLIANCLFNSWFIFFLGWGATSVAFATSLSAWLNLIFLSLYLSRIGFLKKPIFFKRNEWFISISVLFASLCLYLCRITFSFFNFFTIFNLFVSSFINTFFSLISLSLLFAIFFICIFFVLKLLFSDLSFSRKK